MGGLLDAPDEGVLFVIAGPSGVGKSSIVRRALEQLPGLVQFSVSATTRAPRAGEVDGRDYIFLSHEAFAERRDAGAFLEWATVYDQWYGTLREPVQAVLAEGRSVLLDIDVQGAAQVRDRAPGAVSVFVLPPDMASLEQRLRDRGTDDEAVIARRMRLAGGQIRGCADFDYLVVNRDLDAATTVFTGILLAEMSRRARRGALVSEVLDDLDRFGG